MRSALPPSFAALTGSHLAAQSAEQLSLAASPIVAVLVLGAGPGQIGLLAMAQTLPFLLLSIPVGMAADRLSRRRLMIACEGLRAFSLLGLVLAVLIFLVQAGITVGSAMRGVQGLPGEVAR